MSAFVATKNGWVTWSSFNALRRSNRSSLRFAGWHSRLNGELGTGMIWTNCTNSLAMDPGVGMMG